MVNAVMGDRPIFFTQQMQHRTHVAEIAKRYIKQPLITPASLKMEDKADLS
ncbi:MAG: hypothetical protein SNJ57_09035 [Cyanobacteriota bacterium]